MDHLSVPGVQNSNNEYKVCVFGSGSVGKSCLTMQFIQGIFIDRYDPTIEDFFQKTIEIDEKKYTVEILDTAGTESFIAMRDLYIKNARGFILVYSITSQASFDDLNDFYNRIMAIKERQPPMVLVGNKTDLSEEQRVIEREKGQALADKWMCTFLETSAKLCINVNEVYYDIVRQIDRKMPAVRKASRQEDMPPRLPIRHYFCCSLFYKIGLRLQKSFSTLEEKTKEINK